MTEQAAAGGEGQNQQTQQTQQGGEHQQQQQQQVEKTWVDSLDPELRESPSVKKFKGKSWDEVGPQVMKSYVHLEKWQVPGEDADPDTKKAFHRRLGVPEKIEEYSAALKPEVPEGVPWLPEIQTEFAQFAHGEGLTPAQATKVLNFYLSRAGTGLDAARTETATEINKTLAGLKTKWGANYSRNTGLVQRAVEEYGSESFTSMLDSVVVKGPEGQDVKLGNHPAMLEFLLNYGEQRMEAGFIQGGSIGLTADTALQKANAIMDNPKDDYYSDDPRVRKPRVAEVQRLLAIAYPDVKRG